MIAFEEQWYLAKYPHVADELGAGWRAATRHYHQHGQQEGLSPSPYFDEQWYRSRYPDIDEAVRRGEFRSGFHHYLIRGCREGRNPHPDFNENQYLMLHQDVAAAVARGDLQCGFQHFLQSGQFEGRTLRNEEPFRTVPPPVLRPVLTDSLVAPLSVTLDDALASHPRINLVLPSLRLAHMSGGPNTALNLVYRLAAIGIPVRLLASNEGVDDPAQVLGHMRTLVHDDLPQPDIVMADASQPHAPASIGCNDVFFGTAWWTVQAFAPILSGLRTKKFLYLIQDFEPGLSAWSGAYALAMETYTMDMIPIVNSFILRDYFAGNRVGRFADAEFAATALAFEPSIDRSFFFPESRLHAVEGRRRLLFYARPATAPRNLFDVGLAALFRAAAAGAFSDGEWELRFIGDPLPELQLPGGVSIKSCPWLGFADYARLMRTSDVLLSLMLSPHPSYPPLEMASCGGMVVTNRFDCKTEERLREYSTNILAPEPYIQPIADALLQAAKSVGPSNRVPFRGSLPGTWAEAFSDILPRLHSLCRELLHVEHSATGSSGERVLSTPDTAEPPLIVYPADWQMSGRFPELLVRSREATLSVRFVRKADYSDSQWTRVIATYSLVTTEWDGLLGAAVDGPLDPGEYVYGVFRQGEDLPQTVRGLIVHSAVESLQVRFQRMLRRQAAIPQPARRTDSHPLFSITTTVYNTLQSQLEELAGCIIGQTCGDWEWLILDNGCTVPELRTFLRVLERRDSRIRLFSTDCNLHIIGGNRYLLERAIGEYIVPVDSDDLVYPDALKLMAHCADMHGQPGLLFSDEQKVSFRGTPTEYIWRPQWSDLYSIATCPASHLMAFRRVLALQVGAYSDSYAQGSHDWDTVLRLNEVGVKGAHISEVLYGWRMHPASAAMTEGSKNYLRDSQVAVLRNALARRGLADMLDVEAAHVALGYYHIVLKPAAIRPPVRVNIILEDCGSADLQRLRDKLTATAYGNCALRLFVPASAKWRSAVLESVDWATTVICYADHREITSAIAERSDVLYEAVIHTSIEIKNPNWLDDAIVTFLLDPETGIVSGPLVNRDGNVESIGYVEGLDGFLASPAYGLSPDHARGAIAFLRRHVTAVYGSFTVFRRAVWDRVGPLGGIDTTDALHGIEFCLRAREKGILTAYTPRMSAITPVSLARPGASNPDARDALQEKFGIGRRTDPYYSAECSQNSRRYGQLADL